MSQAWRRCSNLTKWWCWILGRLKSGTLSDCSLWVAEMIASSCCSSQSWIAGYRMSFVLVVACCMSCELECGCVFVSVLVCLGGSLEPAPPPRQGTPKELQQLQDLT